MDVTDVPVQSSTHEANDGRVRKKRPGGRVCENGQFDCDGSIWNQLDKGAIGYKCERTEGKQLSKQAAIQGRHTQTFHTQ